MSVEWFVQMLVYFLLLIGLLVGLVWLIFAAIEFFLGDEYK